MRVGFLLPVAVLCVVPVGYLLLRNGHARTTATAVALDLPSIVIDQTTYDFGMMEVGKHGSHTFAVSNQGTGPLRLTVANTTCKCTKLEAPKEIAPGQSSEVRVEWDALEPIDGFRHGGTLSTNDPKTPFVNIYVEGRIRSKIMAMPASIVISDVLPHETREAELMVVSHLWKNMRVEPVDTSIDQLTVEHVEPNSEELKADPWVASGDALKLKLAPGLPVGTKHGVVRYRVHSTDDAMASSTIHETPVVVEVVTPFSIHGRKLLGKMMSLGVIRRGRAVKETAMVVVRGKAEESEIIGATCQPEAIKVSFRKGDSSTGRNSRYQFDIEIPANTPVMSCMAPTMGVVTLKTTHPTCPEVKFYVEFAVIE